jgi:hypothetical protein
MIAEPLKPHPKRASARRMSKALCLTSCEFRAAAEGNQPGRPPATHRRTHLNMANRLALNFPKRFIRVREKI